MINFIEKMFRTSLFVDSDRRRHLSIDFFVGRYFFLWNLKRKMRQRVRNRTEL